MLLSEKQANQGSTGVLKTSRLPHLGRKFGVGFALQMRGQPTCHKISVRASWMHMQLLNALQQAYRVIKM